MATQSSQDRTSTVPSELDIYGNCAQKSSTDSCDGPSSLSCSTSAGSASPPPSPSQVVAAPSHTRSAAHHFPCSTFPEFEYPVPYSIRNTFIDAGIGRPLSLEEFYEERRVHSCPVQLPPGLGDEEAQERQSRRSATHESTIISSAVAAAAAASAAAVAATRCWLQRAPRSNVACCQTDRAQNSSAMPNAPILLLAEALAEPELGSPEKPTVGSVGHNSGTCKPCAFYHTKGCGNGVECGFCHLCPPGEKKRRQKDKFASQREMHRMQSRL